MPTANIADIGGFVRRVTGSANPPLNSRGREQSRELAEKTRGQFHGVVSSPMRRSMETARAVHPAAKEAPELGPWKLGQHEGKPSDQERGKINARILSRPYVPTGKSEHSRESGESFHQFQHRVIGFVQKEQKALKPGEKRLYVTHGRNMRLLHSWQKNGAPADRSIDKNEMTKDGEWSEPGQASLKIPGHAAGSEMHFARHGETNWSASENAAVHAKDVATNGVKT